MKLVIVTGKPFRVTCVECDKTTQTDREQFFADVEGKPFIDYYCSGCACDKPKVKVETL